MKKIIIITSIFATLLLTACTDSKYVLDNTDFPEDFIVEYETKIEENLEKFNNTEAEEEKLEYAAEIAFEYMTIRNFKEAITYYEMVLEVYPTHYLALNNVAYMHETVGELEEAIKYQQMLYEANPTTTEVIKDLIRMLVNYEHKDIALSVLETYAVTESAANNGSFISEQYEFINQ